MKKFLTFVFLTLVFSFVVNAGMLQPEPITVNVSSAGDSSTVEKFSVNLAINETVNITTTKPDWFVEGTPDFPIFFNNTPNNKTIMENVSYAISVPSDYTEPTAKVPLTADFSKTGIQSKNITVTIENVPSIVFNDSITEGEVLQVGAVSEITLQDIQSQFAIFSIKLCSTEYLFLQESDTEIITCSGSQVILTLKTIDTESVSLLIKSNIPVSVKQEAEKTLQIKQTSRLCPGRIMLFETMSNGEHVATHVVVKSQSGNPIENKDVQNGWGEVFIPDNVKDGIIIRAIGIEDESLVMAKDIYIKREICETIPTENETNQTGTLSLGLFNKEKQIEDGEACVSLRVTEKQSGNGLEGANLIIFSDVVKQPIPQSGISGYKTLCFKKPGDYQIHAEKDGWKASDTKVLTIAKPEQPKKVRLIVLNASNNKQLNSPFPPTAAKFKLMNNKGNKEDYTGNIRFSLDGDAGEMPFQNGISQHPKGGQSFDLKEGSYSFQLSDINFKDDGQGLDKGFTVKTESKGSFPFVTFLIIIVVLIIIIGLALWFRGRSGGEGAGYGEPSEEQEVVEEV